MDENIFSDAKLSSDSLPVRSIPIEHILVVEDDLSIRELNAKVLKRFGYQVKTAVNGVEAWHLIQSERFDLVITDQNMPHMSGAELLKLIKNAGMVLPVIMVTAVLPELEFCRNPLAQPDAVVLKPYSIDELLEMVYEVLHLSQTPCSESIVAPTSVLDNRIPL